MRELHFSYITFFPKTLSYKTFSLEPAFLPGYTPQKPLVILLRLPYALSAMHVTINTEVKK